MGERQVVRGFRDLVVWQKSMGFVTDVYRQTRCFPKEELYGLTSQLRRAAVSIPSNVAEGYSRSRNDYLRFLRIALGSIYESRTQLEIALNLDYLEQGDFVRLDDLGCELERMVTGMISSLANKGN